MSLRVWLPLNGNLDNQGLDQVTVTNNGAVVDNNGKIGKCYSFDGSDDYISLNGSCLYDIIKGGSQPFSIGFWIYQADSTRAIIFGDYSLTGGIGFNIELTAGHAVRFYWNGSPDLGIGQLNVGATTWNHVVLVYDTTHLYGYLNGNLVYTYTGTLTDKNKTSGDYYLGRDYRTGNTALNGKMNDVRIYDHALSPLEVKQISQGLVLHYPLNRNGWGQENLYTGSHDFFGSWVNGSLWTISSETYKGFTVKQKSSIWGGLAQNIPCSNGDIFTISFYAKVESGGRICSIHRSSLGNVTTGLVVLKGNFISGTDWINATDDGTQWNRYWATLQITSSDITYLQWRIENSVANKTLYVCGMKLEKGSKATPWCPNSADVLYNTLGLNDNVEYDTSGYGNNGTRTGTFSWTSDTPRYNVSQTFSGTQYIVEPNEINTTDSTIALWIKSALNTYIHVLDARNSSGVGKQPIFQYADGSIQTGGNNDYVTTNTGLLVANTWVHVALVQSGNSLLVYKNGILFQTIPCNNSPIVKPTVGARLNFTNRYTGQLSDFRIYATALSAEDVKSLYNNSAYIDNQGNLYGTTLTEV